MPAALPKPQPSPDFIAANDQLADQITQLSAHLDAGTYQLLKLITQFDENKGWNGEGVLSCAHWLNWKCGINLGAAREQVRVARAIPQLPKISAAFRQGKVSYSKVRAMTRVATPKNEDALLNVAMHGTASHVEQQVRAYRKTKRIEALQEENRRHAQRELSWYTDDDGSYVLKGRFPPDQGALISKALEAAMDQLFEEQEHVPEDVPAETSLHQALDHGVTESVASRRADALERVVEGFLANSEHDRNGGDRYLVNIHTDIETLKEYGDGSEAELEDKSHVSAETSRRISCDCSLVHWHENKYGNPLNIGRKSRTIPPSIRRALKRRDRGCRFPGCSCTRFVDAHHIKHWADGGVTSMHNLVLLCRNHHRLVHEGGFGVHIAMDQDISFSLPDGKTIAPGPDKRFRGNVAAIESANRQKGLEITPATPVSAWHGEKMDPQMAVAALLTRE